MRVCGKKSAESPEERVGPPSHRIVAGVTAAALVSLGLIVAGGGSAQAATGTGTSGWSSNGATLDVVRTYWNKTANTGYNDFNLARVGLSDSYSGWYWTGSYWKHGSAGYVYKASSNAGNTVLLTSMSVGAFMTLDSASDPSGVSVTVHF